MIILASKSPRRKELLSFITEDFTIIPAVKDEVADETLPPEEYVRQLAVNKAAEVYENRENDCVIGSDTVVEANGEIFGKPKDAADAFRMLRTLSGSTHRVHTGVCVILNGEKHSFTESTSVRFFELSDDEINAYIASGEPFDKAGAYGIQDKGALLVESIEGDYYNIMGLPAGKLNKLLKQLGVV